MKRFSTTGIVLRRTEYGDFDLIVTCLSPERGKMAAIAKAARKSRKRFSGILELFSVIQLVCTRGRGMAVLQEATLREPFAGIRAEIGRMALASYWAELIDRRVEEGQPQAELYRLLERCLHLLEDDGLIPDVLNLLFQLRYLNLAGLAPVLTHCTVCRQPVEQLPAGRLDFDLRRGGLACSRCHEAGGDGRALDRGTLKGLLWLQSGPMDKAGRIRLHETVLAEARRIVEAFVCYHFEVRPRSLEFLRELRGEAGAAPASPIPGHGAAV